MPAMNVRVVRRGPAGKYEMWRRCRDVERWPTWMSLVRAVDASGPLMPGLEGVLVLPVGIRVRFAVLEVNDAGPSWMRELRLGPFRLLLDHHVDDGFGLVEASGPFPVPLAYVPFARRSLSRLLRRGGQSPPVA
jgi:hypothetical protein